MNAFRQIFLLELRAAVRGWMLPLLAAAVAAWTLGLPYLLSGDGTPAGEYQLYVRYALGGACCLLAVALGAAAAGSLAKDRQARRLAQTAVRPVPFPVIALGRWAALTLAGALVLALACALVPLRLAFYPHTFPAADGTRAEIGFSLARPCHHVLAPVFEHTPREEALAAYEAYLRDPATSNATAQVARRVALDILTQRAEERFEVVGAGTSVEWPFPAVPESATRLAVRMKFSNRLDTKGCFVGRLSFGPYATAVSNVTQAVLVAPLDVAPREGPLAGRLRLDNVSSDNVMLRPRKDVNLLYGNAADTFARNLVYAGLSAAAMLSLIVSFALLLGACLGRSVAVFTTMTLLFVAEVAPSISREGTEDAVHAGDRIALAITGFVEKVTAPIGSAHPVETLSEDECLELGDVLRTLAVNVVLAPLVLAFLAGLVIPKKPE